MVRLRAYFVKIAHNQAFWRRLFFYASIILIFFGAFLKPDFATDTYADALDNPSSIIHNFLRCGRLFTAAIYAILRLSHINISLINVFSCLIAILSLIFALIILEKLLRQNFIKNHLWSLLLPILILINPFIIEYFLFIEKGIMCFSILLCVISAYYYCNYLTYRQSQDLLKVVLLNILATFLYQGVIGLFIILATLITVLKSRHWSAFFKDTLISVGLYIVGPLLNVIVIKLFFADGRASGGLNIIESAKVVVSSLNNMFQLFNILPASIFWGFLALVLILWLCYSFKYHRIQLLPFAQILYLSIVTFLAAIVPQLVLAPTSVWLAPRAVYPFAIILGIIMVFILHTAPILSARNPWKSILLIATCSFGIIEFVCFNQIILDHYSLAEIDRLRAEYIGQIISAYEEAHSVEIKNIAPSGDQYKTYSYPGIKTVADSNISAFSTEWSDVTSINFWNQRNFVRQTPDHDWQNYCASHDWQDFNIDQLRFTGETLQICWY